MHIYLNHHNTRHDSLFATNPWQITMITLRIVQKKSHFRREWAVVNEDQYLNAATVSAHPTNPIQLSAAKKHRSIHGLEGFLKVKTGENGNSPTASRIDFQIYLQLPEQNFN